MRCVRCLAWPHQTSPCPSPRAATATRKCSVQQQQQLSRWRQQHWTKRSHRRAQVAFLSGQSTNVGPPHIQANLHEVAIMPAAAQPLSLKIRACGYESSLLLMAFPAVSLCWPTHRLHQVSTQVCVACSMPHDDPPRSSQFPTGLTVQGQQSSCGCSSQLIKPVSQVNVKAFDVNQLGRQLGAAQQLRKASCAHTAHVTLAGWQTWLRGSISGTGSALASAAAPCLL